MSTLDLSPRPGAASNGRMVRAQTVMELRLLSRNGEQLLLTLIIPLLLLVMGTVSYTHLTLPTTPYV